MGKWLWLGILMLAALGACSGKIATEREQAMARSYGELTRRFDLLQDQMNERLRGTGRIVAETNRLLAEKKLALEKLLAEIGAGAGSDSLNLLRSKIMIETGRFDDAERIIDPLSSGREDIAREAKLQMVILHLIRRRPVQAAELLGEIEPGLARDDQYYGICLALALTHPDAAVREGFSLRLIDAPQLPARIGAMRPRVLANLAGLAKEKRQPDKARDYLKRALAMAGDSATRSFLEGEQKQLSLWGQPPPSLPAETWLNSVPLSLAALKGKVVVIDFWAPWCDPCRVVMPALQEQFMKFRDRGLLVIGYTRLYGRTGGELQKKDYVPPEQELALIRDFIERSRITYPIAISTEGTGFEAFAVTAIPALAFIDRRGTVVCMKTGAGSLKQIENTIQSLLEEK